jgi:hypothetical protein
VRTNARTYTFHWIEEGTKHVKCFILKRGTLRYRDPTAKPYQSNRRLVNKKILGSKRLTLSISFQWLATWPALFKRLAVVANQIALWMTCAIIADYKLNWRGIGRGH